MSSGAAMPVGKLQEDLRLRQSLPLKLGRGTRVSSPIRKRKEAAMTRVGLFACAVLLAILSIAQSCAEEIKAGDLVITQAWSRATPGGAKVGGGYLTIENVGSVADRLIGGSADIAEKVQLHEMAVNNGVMTMRPLDQGLVIEPGKTVKLAPGGYHLMLLDLKNPLKQGDKVPVTLEFERAGKVSLLLDVQGIGAQGPASSDGSRSQMEMQKTPDHSGMKM